MSRPDRLWINQSHLDAIEEESKRCFPRETGGVLMGWRTAEGDVRISALTGPGPNAQHERFSFDPDHDWQLAKIAEIYESSGRRVSYLGDWHTHPDAASGCISGVDRAVMARISRTTLARCNEPLMLIVWGEANELQFTAWRGRLEMRRPFPWRRFFVSQLIFVRTNE